ncbi:hypothetical protein KAT95_02775 [Candidatus Parcubacteria bacterium]|nr:hypothetical protein [Candidatus Parcubacteria bacterium]
MNKLYYNLFGKHNRKVPFVVLVYFFATFVIVRILVYAWTYGYIPELSLMIKGIEVHHFNIGIFTLAVVGYLLLVSEKEEHRLKIAKIYGIGLALAFDEFGMWLHLDDNYWLRHSLDAVVVISVVLFNIIYLNHIWRKVIEQHIILGRKILSAFRKDVEKKSKKILDRKK